MTPVRLPGALRRYAADLRTALAATPVEAALAVGLAVCLSISLREPTFTGNEFERIAAAVALAFPLVFATSLLRARGAVSAAARWGGTAAALGLASWLGLAWLHADRDGDWWRWLLLTGAAVFLLLLVPALPWRRRDARESWAFAARLVARVAGIGIYAGVLYLLLAGAVGAVVSLFELRDPQHLYADLAGAVFFALAPLMLVGGIHRLAVPPERGVPPAVALLGRWLYAPALVLYLVILYAYGLKVAATGELPQNLLSPLVIAAGVIGLLGAYLLHPVHESGEHRFLSRLVRLVPLLLLPLVPLALWGLSARLGEYGWTEFRYVRLAVVVAIGALGVLGTARLARRAPPLHASIPALLSAVLLLAAVGPWSAPAVSLRDQTARLRAALAEAGVDPRRLGADTVAVDSAAYARIEGAARYLADAHGPGALRRVVPALPDSVRSVWETGRMMGLRMRCEGVPFETASVDWRDGVPGVAGGTIHDVQLRPGGSLVVGPVRAWMAGSVLMAEGSGWRARGRLPRLDGAVESGCGPASGTPWQNARLAGERARVDLRDAYGTLRAQFVVELMRMHEGTPAEVRGLLVVPSS